MIQIRPIQPHEWQEAKRVVYRVAHVVFNDPRTLEDSIAYHESRHELKDMDDIQVNYFENGGTFLAMFDDDEMICTGPCQSIGIQFRGHASGQNPGRRKIDRREINQAG